MCIFFTSPSLTQEFGTDLPIHEATHHLVLPLLYLNLTRLQVKSHSSIVLIMMVLLGRTSLGGTRHNHTFPVRHLG